MKRRVQFKNCLFFSLSFYIPFILLDKVGRKRLLQVSVGGIVAFGSGFTNTSIKLQIFMDEYFMEIHL